MPRRHDPNLIQAIGSRIGELRRARSLTQEQLAEQAGLETLTISRCEQGDRALSLANLVLVADALEVPVGDLLDQARPARPPQMPADEMEWLGLYRAMSAEERARALRVVRALR